MKLCIKTIRKVGAFLLFLGTLCVSLPVQAEEIKISEREYKVSMEEQGSMFLSNAKPVSGEVGTKVFMTYTVEKGVKSDSTQFGIIATTDNKASYPYVDNGIIYCGEESLLDVGYTYVLRMERTDMGFEYQCAKLKDEEAIDIVYEGTVGVADGAYTHYGIWIGGYGSSTGVLSHVRCYDADGNNLGLDSNYKTADWWKGPLIITYTGELDDYSKAEAVYYSKEIDSFVILNAGKKAVKQNKGVDEQCTYKIDINEEQDTKLYLQFESGKEIYEYLYQQLADTEGNRYRRLKDSTVTFVTGEDTFTEKAEAANGYRIEEPEKPIKKENKFKEWCLGDGTPFDFNTVVTESITLYAKWQDGDGNEYLAVESPVAPINYPMIIAITASALIAGGGVLGCMMIVRRKKHDKKETN